MKDDVLSMQIEQARNGDEQAIAGLIARQMPQIRSLAAKAVRPGLDFDDAVQEGIIGLFSALETFDAQKGAAFATYANVCVQNAIVSAVRAAGPEELVMQSERYTQTMQSIDTRLSALEKQVLALFLDGNSYSAIAKRLNVSEKAVDNALQRVRAKLK